MKVNELEDKVMGVWSTCEDIDTFLYRYLDSPAGEMSEDDIANTLLGIKTLHDQRCQKLWDAFEEVIKSNRDYKGISSGMPLEGTAAISSPTAAEFITLNHSSAESLLQADREPLESEI
tara:strand:- start:544 stop:900 length:357 start_codon:yes stop_codon:yes gene_type:complete